MHWERLPTIEADRIRLRWISAEDTDAFFKIYSHPEVMRYWSTPPLVDRDAAGKLIDDLRTRGEAALSGCVHVVERK